MIASLRLSIAPFRWTFMLLAIAGLLCFCTAFQCKPISSSKVKKEVISYSPSDTTILIRGKYQVQIPTSYSVETGQGEDSESLQIRNEDGSLVLDYEVSLGEGLIQAKIRMETLQEEYSTIKTIKKTEGGTLYLAYRSTNNTFRNIQGQIFLENNNIYQEVLQVSCHERHLDRLQAILLTFQTID